MPVNSDEYANEVSKEVRQALGFEIALVDPAAETIKWLDTKAKRDFVDLDDHPSVHPQKGGVVARLRRLFS